MNRIGWSVINSTNLTKRINTKLKPTPKEVGFSIRELCGIKCFGFTTLSPIQDGGHPEFGRPIAVFDKD